MKLWGGGNGFFTECDGTTAVYGDGSRSTEGVTGLPTIERCTPSGEFVCVTTPPEDKIECQEDADCPAPASDTQISFCAAYECHTLDKCDEASAGGLTCTQDEDCGVSGTCNNGTCSNPCASDAECGASDATTLRLCKDGFCRTSPRDEDRIPECYEDQIDPPTTTTPLLPDTDNGGQIDPGDGGGGDDWTSQCQTDTDCESIYGGGATCSSSGQCNVAEEGFDCEGTVCTSTDENAEPFVCPTDNPNCTETDPVNTEDSCTIKFVVQGSIANANIIQAIFYEITGGDRPQFIRCPGNGEIGQANITAAKNLAAKITELKKIPTAAEYDAGTYQQCTNQALTQGARCTAKDSQVSGCLFRVHPAQTSQNVAWTAFATLTLLGLLRAFRPRRRG